MRFLILAVVTSILLATSVSAIGISPPRADIAFSPGVSGSFDVLLQNTLDRQIEVAVSYEGELGKYFEVDTPSIGPRGQKTAEISFQLPEDIRPGMHRVNILFTENYFSEAEGTVAVRTGVAFSAFIWKPFPGRYAELTISPSHVPAGENTDVRMIIESKGDQYVEGELSIRVEDPTGALIDAQVQPAIRADGDSTLERFFLLQSANWQPGRYSVTGTYDYQEGKATDTKTLILGQKTVLPIALDGEFYKDKDVNRFTVEVESQWNEPLDGVSASMQLGANTGRTPSTTLASFSSKTLVGYWDTDISLPEGEHPVLVKVDFADGDTVEKTFTVRLHNTTPVPEVQQPEKIVYIGLADIAFFGLLLSLLIVFVLHHRKQRK